MYIYYLSVCPSVCLSIFLSMSVHLSVCLSVRLAGWQAGRLAGWQAVCLSLSPFPFALNDIAMLSYLYLCILAVVYS